MNPAQPTIRDEVFQYHQSKPPVERMTSLGWRLTLWSFCREVIRAGAPDEGANCRPINPINFNKAYIVQQTLI